MRFDHLHYQEMFLDLAECNGSLKQYIMVTQYKRITDTELAGTSDETKVVYVAPIESNANAGESRFEHSEQTHVLTKYHSKARRENLKQSKNLSGISSKKLTPFEHFTRYTRVRGVGKIFLL